MRYAILLAALLLAAAAPCCQAQCCGGCGPGGCGPGGCGPMMMPAVALPATAFASHRFLIRTPACCGCAAGGACACGPACGCWPPARPRTAVKLPVPRRRAVKLPAPRRRSTGPAAASTAVSWLAPAPLARRPRPLTDGQIRGSYVGLYGTTTWVFTLGPERSYTALWGGASWVGNWARVKGAPARIQVEEWAEHDQPHAGRCRFRWRIDLLRDPGGRLTGAAGKAVPVGPSR